MQSHNIFVIKENGIREMFDPLKLRNSLARSGASEDTIAEIVPLIESEIEDGMSTAYIYKRAFGLLRKFERSSAVKYSLRRAIMELGPSGFPFERYVAEIFKERGYKTLNDVIAEGKCAKHEIDVAAWNENHCIVVEAKFHNVIGLKSDLKVALYVKARFEDLIGRGISFGSEQKTISEGWLVTNTKFTSSAVGYGECQRLKMIGWNYPSGAGLKDMIEREKLHPLTCLTSLTRNEKNLLLVKGAVLCKSLKSDSSLMSAIGMSAEKIRRVRKEIEAL